MTKIEVNKFNFLEFEPHKINDINDKDRYFNVYLTNRSVKKELIAEMKVNLEDDKKSRLTIKKKGDLVHPKALLAMNNFMSDYKDD
jgi:hypothetical protein